MLPTCKAQQKAQGVGVGDLLGSRCCKICSSDIFAPERLRLKPPVQIHGSVWKIKAPSWGSVQWGLYCFGVFFGSPFGERIPASRCMLVQLLILHGATH